MLRIEFFPYPTRTDIIAMLPFLNYSFPPDKTSAFGTQVNESSCPRYLLHLSPGLNQLFFALIPLP